MEYIEREKKNELRNECGRYEARIGSNCWDESGETLGRFVFDVVDGAKGSRIGANKNVVAWNTKEKTVFVFECSYIYKFVAEELKFKNATRHEKKRKNFGKEQKTYHVTF